MPKLSVWMLRASLVHMGAGFLCGALLLFQKGIAIYSGIWRLLPAHMEIMVFGWTVQFVMGLAFWILPRFSQGDRYGNTPLCWWSFALLNTGVGLLVCGVWTTDALVMLVSRILEVVAILLFVFALWSRVKPPGRQAVQQKTMILLKE